MASLLSLPIELRFEIYKFLLPQNDILSFEPSHVIHGYGPRVPPAYNLELSTKDFSISTNIMATNRQIHEETCEMMYRQNEFRFSVHRAPARLNGCRVVVDHYVPNKARTFPMLPPAAACKIAKIELRIDVNYLGRVTHAQMKGWLEKVVLNLSGHQLKSLNLVLCEDRRKRYHQFDAEYCLEPLAALRGINKVQVLREITTIIYSSTISININTSVCTSSFTQRFSALMMSKNKLVLPLKQYADKIVLRKPPRKARRVRKTVSEKKWWEPTYAWEDVVRNEITDANAENRQLIRPA